MHREPCLRRRSTPTHLLNRSANARVMRPRPQPKLSARRCNQGIELVGAAKDRVGLRCSSREELVAVHRPKRFPEAVRIAQYGSISASSFQSLSCRCSGVFNATIIVGDPAHRRDVPDAHIRAAAHGSSTARRSQQNIELPGSEFLVRVTVQRAVEGLGALVVMQLDHDVAHELQRRAGRLNTSISARSMSILRSSTVRDANNDPRSMPLTSGTSPGGHSST